MSAKPKAKPAEPPKGNDTVLKDDQFTEIGMELDESIALVALLRNNNMDELDEKTLAQVCYAIEKKLERARDILQGEPEEATS